MNEMKAVPDLPNCFADAEGVVWRLKDNTITPCKTRRLKNGYLAFNAKRPDGKWVTIYVHRAVGAAWMGTPPEGAQTRHLDGKKLNNKPDNLAWGDSRSQFLDKLRHGTTMKGTKNPAAKLNSTIAFAMREMVKAGLLQRVVAQHFGVHQTTVSDVVQGKRWNADQAATAA